MDKWLDNQWFMKAVALLLAFLLFSTVPKLDPDKPGDVNVPSDENTETISEVPVKSYYDTKNLIVTGVPETVDITIQGPKNIVQQAKALRDFEVFVDLTEQEMGKHQIEISIRDISERLTVDIEPATITVSIQERVTKEFNLEAEYNSAMVADGYIAGSPSIEPNNVEITGAKDIIDAITYVKATVNLTKETNETTTREASILVLDKDMNKLDVIVEPETVDVTIPIESSSKKVPIEIITKGTTSDGVTIDSITPNVKEATIIANPDILKDVQRARVEIDISNITEDTEVTLPVIISNGIVNVSPEIVKLSIKVKKQEEITIPDIPIGVTGQADDYDVEILDPKNGKTSVIATGQSELITSLEATDLQLLVDVSGLLEGEHSVDINVAAPTNINWKLVQEKVNVLISKRET